MSTEEYLNRAHTHLFNRKANTSRRSSVRKASLFAKIEDVNLSDNLEDGAYSARQLTSSIGTSDENLEQHGISAKGLNGPRNDHTQYHCDSAFLQVFPDREHFGRSPRALLPFRVPQNRRGILPRSPSPFELSKFLCRRKDHRLAFLSNRNVQRMPISTTRS